MKDKLILTTFGIVLLLLFYTTNGFFATEVYTIEGVEQADNGQIYSYQADGEMRTYERERTERVPHNSIGSYRHIALYKNGGVGLFINYYVIQVLLFCGLFMLLIFLGKSVRRIIKSQLEQRKQSQGFFGLLYLLLVYVLDVLLLPKKLLSLGVGFLLLLVLAFVVRDGFACLQVCHTYEARFASEESVWGPIIVGTYEYQNIDGEGKTYTQLLLLREPSESITVFESGAGNTYHYGWQFGTRFAFLLFVTIGWWVYVSGYGKRLFKKNK